MHSPPPILKMVLVPLLMLPPFYTMLIAQAEDAPKAITCTNESNGFGYNDFISGSFKTQYEGRWAEGQDDHDMYEYLRFKTKDFLNNKVTISGSGRVTEDLDGHEPQTGAFRDILDTNDSRVNERLYYLYADIRNPVVNQSSLRIGRQYQYSIETILLDGAKYEQRIGAVDAYVFGGLRASQYSSAYFDTVVGSGVAVQPFMSTRTNLDYVRIIDDNFIDDEVGVNLWQRIYDDVNLYGRYTLLNTQPKDFLVSLSWNKIDWDASVQVSYFRFFRSIADQSNNVSPYYQILGTFEPFDIVSLTGYKGLGEKFGISSGVDHRSVIRQSDENNFNRSYNRTFLSFSARNVLLQKSKAALTLEYWNTEGVDHSTDIGVDFDKKINKFDVGAGTSYSLYKYNFDGTTNMSSALNNEFTKDIEQRINVRTYYLKVKYLLTKHSDVNMQWSTEISDTDPGTFHELRLSYSTNF